MALKLKFGPLFPRVSSSSSSSPGNHIRKLSSRMGLLDSQRLHGIHLSNIQAVESCQLAHSRLIVKKILSKRQFIPLAASDDPQSTSDITTDDSVLENENTSAENTNPSSVSYLEGTGGKPGFISFHGHSKRSKDEILVSSPVKNQNNLLWFVGPCVLVASFVFPSLYLRRIISTIFEDSLLTDFLILFFTEAVFYGGVAIFLLMIDRLQRPAQSTSAATDRDLASHVGHRISNVAILVLSLIIPMVTMGFVWPWTGPAASATLAPYLVGIVVQFAFERYARHISSPSWPAIPVVFQVYRLHQLNRAAQLVTALAFTVRGAEMTPHNLAINGSLSTLLNVLQFLGIICIWSLSSFIMRYFPSASSSS